MPPVVVRKRWPGVVEQEGQKPQSGSGILDHLRGQQDLRSSCGYLFLANDMPGSPGSPGSDSFPPPEPFQNPGRPSPGVPGMACSEHLENTPECCVPQASAGRMSCSGSRTICCRCEFSRGQPRSSLAMPLRGQMPEARKWRYAMKDKCDGKNMDETRRSLSRSGSLMGRLCTRTAMPGMVLFPSAGVAPRFAVAGPSACQNRRWRAPLGGRP